MTIQPPKSLTLTKTTISLRPADLWRGTIRLPECCQPEHKHSPLVSTPGPTCFPGVQVFWTQPKALQREDSFPAINLIRPSSLAGIQQCTNWVLKAIKIPVNVSKQINHTAKRFLRENKFQLYLRREWQSPANILRNRWEKPAEKQPRKRQET